MTVLPHMPRPDWFLTGMVMAVALAWIFPQPGSDGGWMHPDLLTKLGIALVFFMNGLLIAPAAMAAGAGRWKLHLLVQGCTFLVMPLIGLMVIAVCHGRLPDDLTLGFFFLCALPSTVSSSVALTAVARGNVPAAVFNATLSSLLGIVLTPLWIGLVYNDASAGASLRVIIDLVLWLLLPLALGQLARPWLGAWGQAHKKRLNLIDRLVILLLVYTSFCDSVTWGVWTDHGPGIVLWAAGGSLALFGCVLCLTGAAARMMKFDRADGIAAIFCGSKKSLAQGVPMARLIFASDPGIGMILLPVMIYHPLQIFICGILARRWARDRPFKA